MHTYLEKYKEAVADYMTAHQIDPTLNAKAMADNIKTFVIKTAGLINKKGGLKPTKVSEITKTIVPTFVPVKPAGESPTEAKAEKQMKTVGFEELKSGKNTDVVVSCKVLSYIDKAMSVPLSFLVMDSKGNCCCVSLYNTSKDVCEDIKPRSDCFIVEPFLSSHELMVEGKLLTYQCIKVTDLRNIYVNGKPLTSRFSKSEVVSKTMP